MNTSRLNRVTYILAALLCVAVVAAFYTFPSQIENMLIRSAKDSIQHINKNLGEYREAHGVYPEKLEDLPDFQPVPSAIIPRGVFYDSWGVPFEYNPSEKNSGRVLRSIRLEKEIARKKIRRTCHYVANGCLLVLAPLILYVRFRRYGRWPIPQGVMLLLPATLTFYIPFVAVFFTQMARVMQIPDDFFDLLPGRFSVLYFYAMFVTAPSVALGSFVLLVLKRDLLYFAALVFAFYIWLVVLSLVS